MTLIVAVATANYALHASDRYTSIQPTPKNLSGDWDMHANKTIVAIGSDCWLVLGYCGLAYLDDKPTDQLIAEVSQAILTSRAKLHGLRGLSHNCRITAKSATE